MKKAVLLIAFVLAASFAYAQEEKATTKTKTTATTKSSAATEDQIKKTERDLWEAWKNKDMKLFETEIPDDAVSVDAMMGRVEKQQMLKSMTEQPCNVASYSLADDKVTQLDKDTALYTYTATVDATCGGQKVPDKVYSSSAFQKRGGKWVPVFHQETPAMPPPSTAEKKPQ
jgi:ketosteroid isomerase-like protein